MKSGLLIPLLLLSGCATSTQQLSFNQDDEARQIYEDLVSAGFLSEEQSTDFGTGMGANESALTKSLGQLADADSEAERDAAREGISRRLAPLGFSAVCFRTPTPGATVRYRPLHLKRAENGPQTNQSAAHIIPLGIYEIWTERGGEPSVPQSRRFKVTLRNQRINLEVERGDTSQLPDCNE